MNSFLKDNIFKILISIPAICTITGTLIINSNLQRYGISDFYIISSKNLIVGITFFAILLLYISSSYMFYEYINDKTKLYRYSKYTPIITVITFPIIASFVFIFFNDAPYVNIGKFNIKDDYKNIILYFYTLSILTLFCVAGVLDEKRKTVKDSQSQTLPHDLKLTYQFISSSTFSLIVLIGLFSPLIHIYSNDIYPLIPNEYGGGKSQEVSISTKNSKNKKGNILYQNQEYIYI